MAQKCSECPNAALFNDYLCIDCRAAPGVDKAEILAQSRLDQFEAFANTLILENGSQMALEDWQKMILRDYFGGCRETLLLIPKKSGKSSLLAAVALEHALKVDDCEFIVVASSRDQ